MSRSKAFQEISIDEVVESVERIYSETVNEDTRDESPMVYKPKEEILKYRADRTGRDHNKASIQF